MLTKLLGIDINRIVITMLGLVGLYLVVTRPKGLNDFIKAGFGGLNESLVILQGRNPRNPVATL